MSTVELEIGEWEGMRIIEKRQIVWHANPSGGSVFAQKFIEREAVITKARQTGLNQLRQSFLLAEADKLSRYRFMQAQYFPTLPGKLKHKRTTFAVRAIFHAI